jgi:MFS family permease
MLWLCGPLAAAAVAMMGLRERPRYSAAEEAKLPIRTALAELWQHRSIMACLLAGKIFVGSAYSAVVTWAAPAFARTFHLPADRSGSTVAAALLVSGITGPLVGGLLADFCQRTGGPRRTMGALSVLALVCVPAGLFGIVPSLAAATVLLGLFATVTSLIGIAEMTLTTIVIPNHLRGLSLSVLIAVGLIFGVGLAPVAISLLSGAVGGPSMIGKALALLCSAVGAAGALAFAFARRYVGRGVESI